ncbi:T9SS type A sorting domain-containing protein [Parasediminibacterium sp. JCM 36343]|uniref:T9SS type A sorting domain-containing protein n=1 Tax=Parasediminibacterium sp. JCM 36343 TaxID=3374279 RepID=UPI003977F9F4
MKKMFTLFAAVLGFAFAKAQVVPFTPGNLVIYRVGKSDSLINVASPVFLDERDVKTGKLVQSIAIPADSASVAGTSSYVLTASGTGTSEGLITRSVDGRYIIFTGYNSTIDTSKSSISATPSKNVKRVIGRVDANGVVNTTTGLSDASSASSFRSAVSEDGTAFWSSGGAGGIRYSKLGDTTSTSILTPPGNIRALEIIDGQLYFSSQSTANGRKITIAQAGTGLPTTKTTTITRLPGVDTTNVTTKAQPSVYQFVILKLNAGAVLYIADNDLDTVVGRGIKKYSLVDTTWKYNGSIKTSGATSIIGTTDGTTASLFATSSARLYSITDASGFDAIPGVSDTAVVLAVRPSITKTAFRGVAFAPVVALPVGLRSFTASLVNNTPKLSWATASEIDTKSFDIEKSLDAKTFTPLASVAATNAPHVYAYDDNSKQFGLQYYRLKIVDNNGSFKYSNIVSVNGKVSTKLEIFPNPATNRSNITLSFPKASAGALIKITSLSGKTMAIYSVQAGATQTSVDVSRYAKSSYIVSFENNGTRSVSQFIK